MSDEELIDGLQQYDVDAQLVLIDRYQNRLVEYLLRFNELSESDVYNIALEVLHYVIENPVYISKAKGSLGGLIFTMAKNKAIDQKRKNRTILNGTKVISLETINIDSTISGENPIPRHFWEENTYTSDYPPKVLEAVKKIIKKLNLSSAEQEHLRFRLEEKFQSKEIASFMGITPNYERVRWHRLMEKINKEWVKHPVLVNFGRHLGINIPELLNQHSDDN